MPKLSSQFFVRLFVAMAAIGGVLYFVRFRTASTGAQAATVSGPNAPRAVPVLTAPAERRDIPVWLEGLGTVTAWQQVTVRPQVDGRLDKIFFREGQTVHRGDLLAQIDPRPFAVQLHQAEGALARDRAQLEAGKRNLERFRTLLQDKFVASQQVDDQIALVGQVEGTVQIDLAAVESARLNLDYARITAPIDGIVGVRLVDAGNLVRAADPNGIVVIAQVDPAAVVFTLPQDELSRIAQAQRRGAISVEAWSRDGQTRIATGQLVVIDNQINQSTATLRLKALIRNPDRQLWPNQFVKARLLLDTERGAMVVPAAAVQRGPQGTFVYVVDQKQIASPRPVEVKLVTAEVAMLGKGLSPGEQVVVEGQNQLRPGAQVVARPLDNARGARGPRDPHDAGAKDNKEAHRPPQDHEGPQGPQDPGAPRKGKAAAAP
ncbi:MAG TPA: efflux RND transporter periplasmic adaptor subunit [Polyangia bacterium]|nr:efflux RND transporter periplasmic adaptor subunit [Polyangia bacterium]